MTKIEWTDEVWNVVTGCEKVSPGCDNCYAETFSERFRGTAGHHFETGFDLTLRPERLELPLKWRKPRRVFVNSMSDLFHKDIPDDYIARAFAVMALTPHHTYQVLTKRHGRMQSLLSSREFVTLVDDHRERTTPGCGDFSWPLRNVWLGVSVEDQQRADLRVPTLLRAPAAVRFLSCEPLLGPVDLRLPTDHSTHERDYTDGVPWPQCLDCSTDETSVDWTIPDGPRIDWVIVGGESGHSARPLNLEWAADLVEQSHDAGAAVFVKQLGSVWARDFATGGDTKGGSPDCWPASLRVREFPKAVPA